MAIKFMLVHRGDMGDPFNLHDMFAVPQKVSKTTIG